MDDVFKMLLCKFILFTVVGNAATTSPELEYISPERKQEFDMLFAQGHFSTHEDRQLVKNSKWTCIMYGMRTRLQVHRDLKLYVWVPGDDEKAAWYNKGAQLISEYRVEDKALVGSTNRLQDKIRLTRSGQLISRLATVATDDVVAYSLCSAAPLTSAKIADSRRP